MSNTSTKMTMYVESHVAIVTGVELNIIQTVLTRCQGDHLVIIAVVILDIVLTSIPSSRDLSSSCGSLVKIQVSEAILVTFLNLFYPASRVQIRVPSDSWSDVIVRVQRDITCGMSSKLYC